MVLRLKHKQEQGLVGRQRFVQKFLLRQELREHCLEARGIPALRYPKGLIEADRVLRNRNTYGVLFGGILKELMKFKQSHPEERKDIDIFAPALNAEEEISYGIDFWGGDPEKNVCGTTLKWFWKYPQFITFEGKLLRTGFIGLAVPDNQSLWDALEIEGNLVAITNIGERLNNAQQRIKRDTGLEVATAVFGGAERR